MTDSLGGDGSVYDWWSRHPRRLDAQPFQHLPLSLLNLEPVPLFAALTDWVPDVDVPAGLRKRFADVAVETYTDGTLFVASGVKP